VPQAHLYKTSLVTWTLILTAFPHGRRAGLRTSWGQIILLAGKEKIRFPPNFSMLKQARPDPWIGVSEAPEWRAEG